MTTALGSKGVTRVTRPNELPAAVVNARSCSAPRTVIAEVDRTVPRLCQVLVPNRDEDHARLKARGIGVGVHYPPNHLQPTFAQWRRDLPATEQAGREVPTLPFHQHLTEADIDQVVTARGQALTEAGTAPHAGRPQQ
ncbi:DegT/DnrJ/EryC1/StrS family aminotransferase [Streptomyces misionensis]|uniref:DegT/DnrJ/EryC1/StrS family aminotransferase n=1 Tax=Streptomyces misionensis TaxID=67331 RepID=UPI0021BD6E87|nr:DegT/DnrJ/EryC1/StrS family aminotransferase [Streptomyces misionensis]